MQRGTMMAPTRTRQHQHQQQHQYQQEQQPDDPQKVQRDEDKDGATAKTREDESCAAVMRRIALFIDGLSRAAILPFGPLLVGRFASSDSAEQPLLSSLDASSTNSDNDSSSMSYWPSVAYSMAILVVIYTLGHALGRTVTSNSSFLQIHLVSNFSVIAGVCLALHLFTFGSGMALLQFLFTVRFLSAFLSGALCQVANMKQASSSGSGGDYWSPCHYQDDATEARSAQAIPSSPLSSGTESDGCDSCGGASSDLPIMLFGGMDGNSGQHGSGRCLEDETGASKTYLCGFAVSVLSGGLLYHTLAKSLLFGALTGGYKYTLSPLFFIAVVIVTDALIDRCLMPPSAEDDHGRGGRNKVRIVGGAVKNITRGIVNGVVRRRGRKSGNNNDEMAPLAIHAEHMDRSFGRQPFLDGDEEEQVEFFDSLSQSRHFDHDSVSHTPNRRRLNSARSEMSDGIRATPNRRRLSSAMSERSEDLFFDCASDLDEEEEFISDPRHVPFSGIEIADELETGAATPERSYDHEIAHYVKGRCIYSDGTPAYVPHGECASLVPENYLKFCNGNTRKAETMWEATKQWRLEKGVWEIHSTPHPFFPKIKEAYPHFAHGKSKLGVPVIYEQPGRMNLKALFRNGCEISDMVRHYMFFMEYISNHLCKDSSSRGLMIVMDIKGASLSHLSGDVLKYLKQASDINSSHYPLMTKRAFLVNSPFWLAGVFSSIKGILPESVQVDILSASNYLAGLREYIDDDQIPPEYGGSSPFPLGEHPFEVELKELVERSCSDAEDEVLMSTAHAPNDSSIVSENMPHPSKSTSERYHFDHGQQKWVHERPLAEDESNVFRPRSRFASGEERNSFEDIPLVTEHGPMDENGVSMVLNSGSWRTELMPSSYALSRRRSSSCGDKLSRDKNALALPLYNEVDTSVEGGGKHTASLFGAVHVFTLVSIIHTVWYAVQSAVETALPLWMMSAPLLGGIGYDPPRSGVTMFCTSIVLMRLMRSRLSRIVSCIPNKAPMRAFRVGAGTEAALLTLLPLIPSFVTSVSKRESVLVMASTIIILTTMALASLLGRSGSFILHRIASVSYGNNPPQRISIFRRLYGSDRFVEDCKSGRFSGSLKLLGEVAGALLVASIFSWSTSQRRPAPFDATCCFYTSSLVCFVLYVSSFSLNLSVIGEFAPHQADGCGEVNGGRLCNATRSKCAFVGEVFAVSVSDMASLFEEANWTSSSVLGYTKEKSNAQSALRHGRFREQSLPGAYGSNSSSMKSV